MRIIPPLTASTCAALILSGCSFTGLNSMPLPLSKGGGDDAIVITVDLENATNLVPNSEVKYREVTVGSVRKIDLDGWTARLTVGLDGDVAIPADVHAQIAQKSLLGAEYLELAEAKTTSTATGELLEDGDRIGLERTGRYPETEELLSAASLMLNGGGLPQIQTIASEANRALTGRKSTVRSVRRQISQASRKLHSQEQDIVAAMTAVEKFSRTINQRQAPIEQALREIPKGLDVLDANEAELIEALESVSELAEPVREALGNNAAPFTRVLDNTLPTLEVLAAYGPRLAQASEVLTWPFPATVSESMTRSGLINIYANIKLSLPDLLEGWFGVPLLTDFYAAIASATPLGGLTDTIDPLTDTLDSLGLAGNDSGADDESTSPLVEPTKPPENNGLLGGLLDSLLGGR